MAKSFPIKNGANLSLTTVERDALTASEGDVIYNTDNDRLETYNGSAWVAVDGGGGGGGSGESILIKDYSFNGAEGNDYTISLDSPVQACRVRVMIPAGASDLNWIFMYSGSSGSVDNTLANWRTSYAYHHSGSVVDSGQDGPRIGEHRAALGDSTGFCMDVELFVSDAQRIHGRVDGVQPGSSTANIERVYSGITHETGTDTEIQDINLVAGSGIAFPVGTRVQVFDMTGGTVTPILGVPHEVLVDDGEVPVATKLSFKGFSALQVGDEMVLTPPPLGFSGIDRYARAVINYPLDTFESLANTTDHTGNPHGASTMVLETRSGLVGFSPALTTTAATSMCLELDNPITNGSIRFKWHVATDLTMTSIQYPFQVNWNNSQREDIPSESAGTFGGWLARGPDYFSDHLRFGPSPSDPSNRRTSTIRASAVGSPSFRKTSNNNAENNAVIVNGWNDSRIDFKLVDNEDGTYTEYSTLFCNNSALVYYEYTYTRGSAYLPGSFINIHLEGINDNGRRIYYRDLKVLDYEEIPENTDYVEIGADLPTGGTTGQSLKKASDADGDVEWADDVLPPSSIDDLTDVDTTTTAPTDGQALVWNEADSEWAPGDVASGGGGGGDAVPADYYYAELVTHPTDGDPSFVVQPNILTEVAYGIFTQDHVTYPSTKQIVLADNGDPVGKWEVVVVLTHSSALSGFSLTANATELQETSTTLGESGSLKTTEGRLFVERTSTVGQTFLSINVSDNTAGGFVNITKLGATLERDPEVTGATAFGAIGLDLSTTVTPETDLSFDSNFTNFFFGTSATNLTVDVANNKLLISEDGFYQVDALAPLQETQSIPTAARFDVLVNGSRRLWGGSSGNPYVSVSGVTYLSNGDEVTLRYRNNGQSVSALTVYGGASLRLFKINNDLSSGGGGGGTGAGTADGVSGSVGSGQALPNNATTGLAFDRDSSEFTALGASDGVFTAPSPGWFTFTVNCRFGDAVTGEYTGPRGFVFYQLSTDNGATWANPTAQGCAENITAASNDVDHTRSLQLQAGDKVRVACFQSTGSTKYLQRASFSATWGGGGGGGGGSGGGRYWTGGIGSSVSVQYPTTVLEWDDAIASEGVERVMGSQGVEVLRLPAGTKWVLEVQMIAEQYIDGAWTTPTTIPVLSGTGYTATSQQPHQFTDAHFTTRSTELHGINRYVIEADQNTDAEIYFQQAWPAGADSNDFFKTGGIGILRELGGSGSGIPEAPQDGNIYGRQNGAWVIIP